MIELYGGAEPLWAAFSAPRLELSRLVPDTSVAAGYRETGRLRILPEDIPSLQALLTSDASFNWHQDFDPTPRYAYRVKFLGGGPLVAVDLCFDCSRVRVVHGEREVAATNFQFTAEALQHIVDRSEAWTKLLQPE